MNDHLDHDTLRRYFPAASRMTYLDSAHQTPLGAPIRAEILRFLDEGHETAGPKATWLQKVEAVRSRLAAFVGAASTEIAFTKNTSEGLNAIANAIDFRPGDNVVLVQGDHPNNAYAWLNLRRKGVEVRFIDLQTNVASANSFDAQVDGRTRVISLSHVTFHAGQRHDIESIGDFCRQRGILLVVDAMQSVGVIPVDVKRMGISALAAGCHKGLLTPQGLGFLYVDDDVDALHPAYLATAGLENPPADFIARPDDVALRAGAGRFELGNFNLPGIYGLDASLNLITDVGVTQIEKHVISLGDHLIERLDELGIGLVGPRERRERAHIYVMRMEADWLAYFAGNNVRVSPERDGIRISFGLFNNRDDVDAVYELIRARKVR
ncbi:aminotransferase class V-fold PLP-dependent enzyme [Paraburkholderia sp. PGU19]|uniref:aminotransferase class V-fold PLP-dependent enzyme n=1 Tax=Paraburkholderia sp. PGU19 TaxID=2735434 RepID=UPI0015DB5F28|nr:aminotransferase class V-fold PLP-dependent enzyme [Paraburkholderia sp. PGU19]